MNIKTIFYGLGLSLLVLTTSCDDETASTTGCMNAEACNYDATADENDENSCTFICLTEEQKNRVINFVDSAVAYFEMHGLDSISAFNAPKPF